MDLKEFLDEFAATLKEINDRADLPQMIKVDRNCLFQVVCTYMIVKSVNPAQDKWDKLPPLADRILNDPDIDTTIGPKGDLPIDTTFSVMDRHAEYKPKTIPELKDILDNPIPKRGRPKKGQ